MQLHKSRGDFSKSSTNKDEQREILGKRQQLPSGKGEMAGVQPPPGKSMDKGRKKSTRKMNVSKRTGHTKWKKQGAKAGRTEQVMDREGMQKKWCELLQLFQV